MRNSLMYVSSSVLALVVGAWMFPLNAALDVQLQSNPALLDNQKKTVDVVQDSNTPNEWTETQKKEPSIAAFIETLRAVDLKCVFPEKGPYTIFIPNVTAFSKVPKEKLALLFSDKAKLCSLLSFHVVPGKLMAADVASKDLTTVNGKKLTLKVEGSDVFVNGAKVVKTDIVGPNGNIIHIIDTVLIPQ